MSPLVILGIFVGFYFCTFGLSTIMNALKKAKLIKKNNRENVDLIISETISPRVFCHATEQSDITYLEPYGKCVTLFKKL